MEQGKEEYLRYGAAEPDKVVITLSIYMNLATKYWRYKLQRVQHGYYLPWVITPMLGSGAYTFSPSWCGPQRAAAAVGRRKLGLLVWQSKHEWRSFTVDKVEAVMFDETADEPLMNQRNMRYTRCTRCWP